MLNENIAKTLRTTATPMVIALLAIGSVGVADTYFVGRLGIKALTALGFCIPIFYVTAAIWIGFGIGATSMISRSRGAGDLALARRLSVDAFLVSAPVVGVLIPVALLLRSTLFLTLGVPGELRFQVGQFIAVMAFGMPAIAFVIMASAILRGHAEVRASGALLLLASFGNIVLDPPLILGFGPIPAFGVVGAGLAAIAGYAIAAVPSLTALLRRRLLSTAYDGTPGFAARVRGMLSVSVPAVASQLIKPTALLALTALVSRFGETAVAAFVAGSNLERLTSNVFLGVASALAPFVGRSWGAGERSRAAQGLHLAMRFTMSTSAIVWLLTVLLSSLLARVFVPDVDAQVVMKSLLRSLPLAYGAAGSTMMCVTSLQAVGRGTSALSLCLLEHIIVGLPLAAAGSFLGGPSGMFAGIITAEFLVMLEARRRVRAVGITSALEQASAPNQRANPA